MWVSSLGATWVTFIIAGAAPWGLREHVRNFYSIMHIFSFRYCSCKYCSFMYLLFSYRSFFVLYCEILFYWCYFATVNSGIDAILVNSEFLAAYSYYIIIMFILYKKWDFLSVDFSLQVSFWRWNTIKKVEVKYVWSFCVSRIVRLYVTFLQQGYTIFTAKSILLISFPD